MKILSIETSCDETSIAILEMKGSFSTRGNSTVSGKVLAHHISSQIDVHIPYGGVFPALAKREHIKNLPLVLDQALKKAKLAKKKVPVDAIAVTYGPGLEPALWTGIVFAQDLAKKWGIPLIPVNHMEGHLLSAFGKNTGTFKIPKIKTPLLALLVSGGHTQLVFSKKWMQYEIIGETLDDAVGEAFDKVARMLGLPYPGGPQISKLAEEERVRQSLLLRRLASATARARGIFQQKNIRASEKQALPFSLPRPMLRTKDFKFSFSGLKTAVLYLVRDLGGAEEISDETKAQIALEFENAAIECLTYKTAKAIEQYRIKTLIVAGGVSANKHLNKEINKIVKKTCELYFPPRELTGDNGLMIGIAGYLQFIKNKKRVPKPESIKASGNLSL
ncbi:MAG: tRNA (adenosine(37)-N6)-threonylcarbamoyltransferase complex transferase subunit TsaD [Candidatus Paceibacterota bacterium]|jgi:N6-L-threonylcarbamoyladenine synthase